MSISIEEEAIKIITNKFLSGKTITQVDEWMYYTAKGRIFIERFNNIEESDERYERYEDKFTNAEKVVDDIATQRECKALYTDDYDAASGGLLNLWIETQR